MIKILFAIIVCVAFILGGCGNTSHCFSVGGTHTDTGITGELTWCVNPQKSQEVGKTVVEGSQGTAVIMSIEDIEKLANISATQEKQVSASAIRPKKITWTEALMKIK